MILNYLLFTISLSILWWLYHKKWNWQEAALALLLPSTAIFIIPYTESLFFLSVVILLYGIEKKRYGLYFLGLCLASFTRPATNILLVSILCVQTLEFIKDRNLISFIKSCFSRLIPGVIGTLLAAYIQYMQGAATLLTFAKVQAYWGNFIQLPQTIKDWSFQGYGIHTAMLGFLLLPFAYFVIRFLILALRKESSYSYTTRVAILYIFGCMLYTLIYRGGSLHGMFRFALCTPFPYLLLYNGFASKLSEAKSKYKVSYLAIGLGLSLACLLIPAYAWEINFALFGFVLFSVFIMLTLFQNYAENRLFQLILLFFIGLNSLWTAYLVNHYLCDGWLFT